VGGFLWREGLKQAFAWIDELVAPQPSTWLLKRIFRYPMAEVGRKTPFLWTQRMNGETISCSICLASFFLRIPGDRLVWNPRVLRTGAMKAISDQRRWPED